MRTRSAFVGLALLLMTAGCSNPVTGPSDTDLSGTWSATGIFTMSVIENGPSLSGTWRNSDGNSGTLSGTRSGVNVSITLVESVAGLCPYSMTGSLSSVSSMTLSYTSFNCTVAISGSLTLSK